MDYPFKLPNNLSEQQIKTMLLLCYEYATKDSDDPRTKNFAMIVDQTNGLILRGKANKLPIGIVKNEARLTDKDFKSKVMIHAEENVIITASREIDSYAMVCPYASCPHCARMIIQSGIRLLIRHKVLMDKVPKHQKIGDIDFSDNLFKEAKVEIIDYPEYVGSKIMFDGELHAV